jgi:hypothetical protein
VDGGESGDCRCAGCPWVYGLTVRRQLAGIMRVRHGDTPAFALYSRDWHSREKIRQGFESFPLAHLFPDLKASKRERTEQIASIPIDASTKVFLIFLTLMYLDIF